MFVKNRFFIFIVISIFLMGFSFAAFGFDNENLPKVTREPPTVITFDNVTGSVNSSIWWNGMNAINTTQMENNGGVLNILVSWLESLIEGSFNSTSWNRSGTNVFLANTGDNVGIGTSTPQNTLNVLGDGNFTGVVYRNNELLIDWIQATNGTLADNTSIATYINSQDISFNNSMKIYVDSQDVIVNTSVTNWVDALFVRFSEIIAQVGNWTADRGDYWNTSTSLDFTTNLTTTGNITADYYFGDGSQLTGISGGIWTNVSGTATFDGDANVTGDIYSNSYQVISYQRTVNIKNVTMTAVI